MENNRCPICKKSFIAYRNRTKGLKIWKVTGKETCYYFECQKDAIRFVNSHDYLELTPIHIIPDIRTILLENTESNK